MEETGFTGGEGETEFRAGELPADLYDYAKQPDRIGIQHRRNTASFRITDNWPEILPITQAEVDVVEAHLGGILDTLFGPLP